MAVHLGWYTSHTMPSSDISTFMNNTALDVFMSFGFRELADWNAYNQRADDVIGTIGSNSLKLILELPGYALDKIKNGGGTGDCAQINSEYDGESKVWGYYIEEPNHHGWADWVCGDAASVMDKPIVVMLQSGGVSQSTVNDYATAIDSGDYIAGFMYPLTYSNLNEWANITDMASSSEVLIKLRDNSANRAFFFGVQAFDGHALTPQNNNRPPITTTWANADPDGTPAQWAQDNPDASPEYNWMLHRAIYEGASGELSFVFYATNDDPTKEDLLRHAVRNMCEMMDQESAHKALDGTPLASSDNDLPFYVQITEPSNPSNDLLYWYRYWSGSYWLLVMDKNPERTDDPYPIDLRFFCNITNFPP